MKQNTQREAHKVVPATTGIVDEYGVVIHLSPQAHSLCGPDIEPAAQGHRKSSVASLQQEVESWASRREVGAGVRHTGEHMSERRKAGAVARLKLRAYQKIVNARF